VIGIVAVLLGVAQLLLARRIHDHYRVRTKDGLGGRILAAGA